MLEWIEEDKNWQKAKELLAEVPPVLHNQLDFRTRRLELLQKAGTPVSELDAEWEELCQEFPENQRLQMSRFDVLVEAERWDQAEKLLTEYERFNPNASYMLARKVQLLAHRMNYKEALSTAVKIWTMPGDDEIWPEHFSWDILFQDGYKKELAHAAINALLAGKRLRLRVFVLLLQHLDLVAEKLKISLRPRRRIQAYLNLMERLHEVEWDPAEHIAAVLDHLHEIGRHRSVVKHCLKHQEFYRKMTPVRQSAVTIMNSFPFHKFAPEVREWMQDWRELPGIQMWGVTNYLRAVVPEDSLITPQYRISEQFESSRDCLQRLAFDHTARYMCCLYCEAALRLEKYENFSEGIEHYRSLLEDTQTEYWMPQKRQHLPEVLLLLKDLYNANCPTETWKISRRLKRRIRSAFPWIAPVWFKMTKDKLSLPRRLLLFCKLLIF